jgi:propanol-preferring alcohol dehydrogenase
VLAEQLRSPKPVGERPLHRVDVAEPEPGPHEVQIEVAACGVCRTDLQIVEGDLEARTLPIIPGHQIVGRITRVGTGVERWKPGDRAGVGWLAGACGHCDRCEEGLENLCDDAMFTGWDRDGGYAQTVVADAEFALAIPDSFDDLEAAPLMCGGVIGYRALKLSGVEAGGKVGMFGFGASALLALQVAVHRGCETYVITRSEASRRRAREMGATWAGGYDEGPPVDLDGAITFAPAGSVVVEALRAVRPGGTVAVNAIHLDAIPEFDYDLLWRERAIRSVANFTRRDAEEFLALAAAIPIETVVDAYPLGRANEALQALDSGQIRGAVVLTP